MKVNLEIDKSLNESIITIQTNEITENISNILLYIENEDNNILGYIQDEVYILKKEDIESIYTNGNNVYAFSNGKEYRLKERLYFYHEMLHKNSFVRISNSELINVKKVKKVKLNLKGTILITFESGRNTYCSRRKINDFKEALNIK